MSIRLDDPVAPMYFSVKSVCCYDAPPAVVLLAFSPSEHLEESIIKNHQESQQRMSFGKIPWQTVGDRVWSTRAGEGEREMH